VAEPDLATPSFAAAYRLSRLRAASGDSAGAARLFSRLLWHVEARDGGFIGLSDEELLEKCAHDKRLNHASAIAAMYAPGPWPLPERNSA
jgi:hypothetical protein